MSIRTISTSAVGLALVLSFGIASADTALSVSCAGVPGTSSITWTATPTGGVAPVSLLWGNGATTTSQTVSYAPGLHSIDIQATDASSTVATSTCSATVAAPTLPSIGSFTATPASITSGQSSLLAWSVTDASSTSIDHAVGVVSGTSTTVSPSVTTTYTLSAVNPAGTTTASATITVTATSTSGGGTSLQEQIQALLAQIRALQQQITDLIAGQFPRIATSTPVIVPPGQIGKIACITLGRNLHEGDSGDDVKSIQELLAEDPQYGFNVTPTGFFGPLTMRAMIRYQVANAIASSTDTDGSVGPLTRGFFERRCGNGLLKKSDDSWNSDKSENSGKSDENRGRGKNSGREDD